ncbi:MAG: hypothetical protein J2P56_06970, partial [Verrucomicrobia bacterium]|nr:hypothetical protein [Verrucomicrobiota bacterium]
WFQLDRTVTNPHKDRRVKYVWHAQSEFSKGMRFLVKDFKSAIDGTEHRSIMESTKSVHGLQLSARWDLYKDLPLTPVEPTIRELMIAFDISALTVLEDLLRNGTITRDQVEAIVFYHEDQWAAGRDPVEGV